MATATATILFTDVEGSTELRAQIGEAAADRLFRDHERRLRSVVDRRGGRVVKTAGDGVMAAFESASDAVMAAVDIQRAVARADERLRVRIGVASGDVSWESGDCYGLPVVTAARLETAAEGGQILVTQVVRWLAGERSTATFEPLGPLELKGLPDPVEAFVVAWEPSAAEGDGPAVVPLPAALASPARVGMVGREAETAALADAWRAVVEEGDRRIVLVSGEAGTGKTRLSAEFARRCHEDGGAVLYGGCDAELAVPYQPWVHVLDHLLRTLSVDDLDAELVDDLGLVAPLLPRLERGGVRLGSPNTVIDAETERYRMFVAIDALLSAASRRWPLVVVLDDVHWASAHTLALLHHLAKVGTTRRMLVIATFRDTAGEIRDPLAMTLAGLRRLETVSGLRVGGLDADDVATLVEEATGQALDRSLRELATTLAQRSRGNPFFLGELWRHLVSTGLLERGVNGWVVQGSLDSAGVPDSVREVVAGRLSRLEISVRRLAELLAVAGHRLELRVLRAAADLPEAEVTAGVDTLVASGMFEVVDRPQLSYEFSHALVRDAVASEVPPAARATLHLRVADALEAAYEADPRGVLADLARHYAEAASLGTASKALYYARRAAEQASASLAYSDAEAHLLAVADLTVPGTRAHVDLLVRRASAKLWTSVYLDAAEMYETAFHEAREHGFADLAAEAAIGFQDSQQIPGLPGGPSVVMVSEAIRLLDRDEGPLRSRLESALGLAYSRTGDLASATAALERAARLAGDDVEARTAALWAGALIETDPESLLRKGQELEAHANATGDLWSQGTSTTNSMRALIALGRMQEARDTLDRHRLIGLPVPLVEVELHCYSCIFALAEARLGDAEASAERALEVGSGSVPGAEGIYGLQLFTVRRLQGRLHEVAGLLQVAAANTGGVWGPGLAVLLAEVGRFDDARAQLDRLAPDRFAVVPRDSLWPASLCFLADACIATDDVAKAPILYEEMLAFRGRNLMVAMSTCLGPADRVLAGLASIMGRHDEADAHHAAALEFAEASESPLWVAEVQVQWARSLLARDPARARELAAVALTTAQTYGIAGLASAAGELLEGVTPMPVVQLPFGLSPRELDVLRLVADGCSNREIGERLTISANTAANHVRSILQKTACANRAEAAAFAARHDLLTS
jgi:class 3 adenylate cyclase/DNA-binding CsgD family transcriptional regulator/tetratricopeptide (TPR) repeat protein